MKAVHGESSVEEFLFFRAHGSLGGRLNLRRDVSDRIQGCCGASDTATWTFPGFEGAFGVMTAPEGTQLYLFEEDFLGESIEVDEDVDPEEIKGKFK